MKPEIESCAFGSIVIDGVQYKHDVTIGLDSSIRKRKKKLSKQKYGTSHIISVEEAQAVYEPGAQKLIIGSGMFGRVRLSEEAEAFFKEKRCPVEINPTGKAADEWNSTGSAVLGLFHITC